MAIASARRVALLVATPGEEGADPVVSARCRAETLADLSDPSGRTTWSPRKRTGK